MVNKNKPHVLIFPEDDANRQLAAGFHMELFQIRQMHILPVAGGWNEVLRQFRSDHVRYMNNTPDRFMVLLIDFDGQQDRLGEAKAVVPARLTERVFILGTWTEPEAHSSTQQKRD